MPGAAWIWGVTTPITDELVHMEGDVRLFALAERRPDPLVYEVACSNPTDVPQLVGLYDGAANEIDSVVVPPGLTTVALRMPVGARLERSKLNLSLTPWPGALPTAGLPTVNLSNLME